jgi:hypothetical protein
VPEAATSPPESLKNSKFSMAVSAWQKPPLGVANRLGPSVVRNIP